MAKGEQGDRREATGETGHPLLMAVDDDVEALRRLTRELKQRYGADYDVVCQRSPRRALETLEDARAGGQEVALVLADQEMPELGGRGAARRGCAACTRRRSAGSWCTGEIGRTQSERAGWSRGWPQSQFDYYVLKPARPGEEQFHRIISEFLYEWARLRSPVESEITLVGGEWSPRTHELRSLLARNGVPHAFVEDDCERGREPARRGRPQRRRGPDRDRPRRADPGQPDQRRARSRVRRQHRARRGARLRRGRRGSRARRPHGGGLRGLGGIAHRSSSSARRSAGRPGPAP